MLKFLQLFQHNLLKETEIQAQFAYPSCSKAEKEEISAPGIIGLGAIWDVYDMWI